MGQARQKSRRLKDLVISEPRCIYCSNTPSTIEHMPPIALFKFRSRPNGMEFAACDQCNRGTSAADLVASFFVRMSRASDPTLIKEAVERKPQMEADAPGVLAELFRTEKERATLARLPSGLLVPEVKIQVDGPLTKRYLDVFSLKFGMALYREHVGVALPLQGRVFSKFYLNAGLADAAAEKILRILPVHKTLQQGKFNVPDQFEYRFNSDNRSIVAALASFHSNFYVFTIAASDPQFYQLAWLSDPASFTCPGELTSLMPSRKSKMTS